MQAYCYGQIFKKENQLCIRLVSGLYDSEEHLKESELTEVLAGYVTLGFASVPPDFSVMSSIGKLPHKKIQPATLAAGGMEAD